MKRLAVFMALALLAGIAGAADINTAGVGFNPNYRDITGGLHAETVNTISANDYSHFTSTTVVKTTPGVLGCVTINTAAAVAFTIYDDTATAVAANTIASFAASSAIGTYCYNIKTSTGILVVGHINGADVTLSYR